MNERPGAECGLGAAGDEAPAYYGSRRWDKGDDTVIRTKLAEEGHFVWGIALGAVCGLLLGSVIGTLLGHDSVAYLRNMTQRLLGRDEDVNFEIFVQ